MHHEKEYSNQPQGLNRMVKDLSSISLARAIYHVVEIWGVVLVAVWSSWYLLPPNTLHGLCLYVVAVTVISARQHALMVVVHEAIHKRIARSLRMNDGLARIGAAFPVFISLSKWKFIHLFHHQFTHTDLDPDRAIYSRYPLRSTSFWALLARDICGRNVVSTLRYFLDVPFGARDFNVRFLGAERAARYEESSDMNQFVLFWIVLLGLGITTGGLSFVEVTILYWLVPYCTFTQLFFRIRGAIEHGNVPEVNNPYRQTRTYFMHPVLKFFFAPKNVNYHLEHHLYPSVPFYHLPKLHAVLARTVYGKTNAYCEPFLSGLKKLACG